MKNKINIISVLVIAIVLVPQITFASWWNPLSWNIFSFLHKKEAVTQVQKIEEKTPEEKINELQKQVNDLKNNQQTIKIEAKPVVKEIKKIVPVVDNSAIIKAEIKAKIDAELKLKAEQEAIVVRQKAEQDALVARQKEEEQARIDEENQARLEAEKEKSNALKAINLKIANLNAKYAKDSAEMKLNKGGSFGGVMQSSLDSLYTKYLDDYNALTAEYQLVKYSN